MAQDAQAEATAEVAKAKSPADVAPITTPTIPRDAVLDRNEDDKATSPAANAEALKRRAGERVGLDPRGRSLVLGMHLQESPEGRVKVVEVAAASPAFDAGIKEGDELVSFAGFRADTYRKWIDGMRRLATDAENNSRLPVVVVRDGKQVTAQIRIPESGVEPVKLPVGPSPTQVPPGPGGVAIGVQGVPVQVRGTSVAIDNLGPFGDFFGRETSPASEKAMAEIFRVGGAPFTGQAGTNASRPGAAPNDRGARIGIAGFRNDPNGMLVMVDVGGLAPGNYLVGISDPGFVRAGTEPGVAPRVEAPPGTPAPPLPRQPLRAPHGTQQQDPLPNPSGNIPADPAGGNTRPQSNRLPAASPQIPKTVLAQVTDNTQPTSGASGTTIPPTGQVSPSTVPPTGQVNPSNTTPTGESTVNNALLEQARQARQANEARRRAGATGGQMHNQIGTLTVDQSGVGRMQTVVEALRVQDVVGQAIVLYSQAADQQKTLPPNLDPTVDPAGGSGVIDPAQAATGQSATGQSAIGRTPPPAPAAPNSATVGLGLNSPNPVAAGIIRLLSDRRPPPTNEPVPDGVFGNPPAEQPANNTPPIGTNPIR
jgi:hypothetical protein